MAATLAGDYFDPATHRYFLGGREVPGVTTVLKWKGLIDTTFLRNEEALRRGTAVHAMCEEIDLIHQLAREEGGRWKTNELDPLAAPYAQSYLALKRDHAPRYTHVERGLLDPALRFGGRPDRICANLCGQGPAILEIKTGSPAPWHAVQLAAYQLLFPTGSRWVVYLRPDGRYRLVRVGTGDDYQTFISALAEYHAARRTERTP